MHPRLLPVLILLAALVATTATALLNNKDVTATPLIKTTQSWNGAALAYPEGEAELSAMLVEIAPGGQTTWHLHTAPSLAVMLEGEIEVHLKDGQVKPFKKGEALAEVVDTLHNGINKGSTPAKMVVFYAGVKDKGLTLMEAEAAVGRL